MNTIKKLFKNKWVQLIFKVLIAIFIIWLIRDKFSLEKFRTLLTKPVLFFVMPLAWVLNICFISVRLKFLLKVSSYHISYLQLLKISFAAMLFSVLPIGTLGSDVIKIGMIKYHKKEIPLSELSALVLLDRMLGVLSMLFITFAASFFIDLNATINKTLVYGIWIGVGAIALSMLVFVLLYNRIHALLDMQNRFMQLFKKIFIAVTLPFRKPKIGIIAFTLSTIAVFCLVFGQSIVGSYLLLQETGKTFFLEQIFVLPASVFISIIPITPMGIGVGQYTLEELYRILKMGSNIGSTVVTLSQLGQFLISTCIGGSLFLLSNIRSLLRKVELEENLRPKA